MKTFCVAFEIIYLVSYMQQNHVYALLIRKICFCLIVLLRIVKFFHLKSIEFYVHIINLGSQVKTQYAKIAEMENDLSVGKRKSFFLIWQKKILTIDFCKAETALKLSFFPMLWKLLSSNSHKTCSGINSYINRTVKYPIKLKLTGRCVCSLFLLFKFT